MGEKCETFFTMRKTIKTLILLLFSIVALNSNAQKKFAKYENKFSSDTLDINISVERNGDYSLLISAMPLGDTYPNGGIILDEKSYPNFLDAMDRAKTNYEMWVKSAKETKTKKLDKVMPYATITGAFFKGENWRRIEKAVLHFYFKVKEKDGKTDYLLIVHTQDLTYTKNDIVENSKGYCLVFTSTAEMDQFLDSISKTKLNKYIENSGVVFSLIKRKDIQIQEKNQYPQFTFGLKAQYGSAFEMNDYKTEQIIEHHAKSFKSNIVNVFNAGVFTRIDFKKLYIQPEFIYGMGQKKYAEDFRVNNISVSKTANVSTLDIPLLLGYKLFDFEKSRLRVFAGPKLRLNIGSSIEYPIFIATEHSSVTISDLSKDVKPSQFGLEAGFEFDFSLFTVGVRYSRINDIYQTTFRNNVLDENSDNSFGISLGWKLFQFAKSMPSSPIKNEETKLISSQKISSKIALLDTLRVSSKTRIIGKCYDHSNPNDLYSFLLKDSTSIVQFAKSLEAGKKVMNMINGPEFDVEIVNDYVVTDYISVNPMLNTIRLKGNTYVFDFGLIKNLHKTYPLICDEKKVNFNSKKEVDDYVIEIKKDTNLLYYFLPEFKDEGSFSLTVKKSKLFNSPKAVMDYLTPNIEKIVKHDEYMMMYFVEMSQIAKQIQSDSYTITISGSKKLFDNLNVDNVKKDNWRNTGKISGSFFMKR